LSFRHTKQDCQRQRGATGSSLGRETGPGGELSRHTDRDGNVLGLLTKLGRLTAKTKYDEERERERLIVYFEVKFWSNYTSPPGSLLLERNQLHPHTSFGSPSGGTGEYQMHRVQP